MFIVTFKQICCWIGAPTETSDKLAYYDDDEFDLLTSLSSLQLQDESESGVFQYCVHLFYSHAKQIGGQTTDESIPKEG